MKVNMTPNPLDVVTIHASQGDTEARQWEFELHNNGELIDTSDVKEQLVFKAYKGGTEELLPSSLMNGFVDLGSLEWTAVTTATSGVYRMRTSGISADVMKPSANNVKANIYNSRYSTITASESYQAIEGIAVEPNGNLFIYDSNYNTSSSATEFKDSLQGVFLWYEKSDSTPTTSPFLGDIRYPQGLLTNQEFTYRQSPTEEDGLAKITDIKGNTLNWNQQVETLITTQDYEGVTFTNNGDGSLTINGTTTNTSVKHPSIVANNVGADGWKASHRYYIELNNTSLQPLLVRWGTSTESAFAFARRNTEDSNSTRYLINGANIGSPLGDGVGGLRFRWNANVGLTFNNAKIIPQIFDLTEMFGTEKAEEIYQMEVNEVGSGVAYFRSLFPLSYYSYNQGSLLSFMGNGIKTVGKNIWDNSQLIRGLFDDADFNHGSSQVFTSIKWYGFANTTYTVSWGVPVNVVRRIIDGTHSMTQYNNIQTFTLTPSTNGYIGLSFRDSISSTTQWNPNTTIQIEEGSSATSYEPYTSSTLSLPISTYFPNGMDGVGTDYDELTNTKATTRMTRVDLGSLDWSYVSAYGGAFQSNGIASVVADSNNPLCAIYTKFNPTSEGVTNTNMGIAINTNGNGGSIGGAYGYKNIVITNRNYTDATAFKTAMSGVYLVFPLATPIETSFTTASLVTGNGEIPLSNEDGTLIGKCTEQLSAEPGFHDAKIKLSDSDGDVYSNKIQLHIERSPQ